MLERMTDEDLNQFPVTDDGRWLGMVLRETLLSFLCARAELRA